MFALKRHILLAVITVPLAILASNFTADILSQPAAQLMSLVRGGKLTNVTLDEKGIPSVFNNRLRITLRNPLTVSLYSLSYHENWIGEVGEFSGYIGDISSLTRDEHREYFLNAADWLVDNLSLRSEGTTTYGVWEYGHRATAYDLDPPWVSGMAQGLGIQALTKAYDTTGDPKYIQAARSALNALFVEVADGGVTYKDRPGEWWYEEYAKPGGKESRVLNGMIFALLGVNEYYEATRDESAKILFDKGIASLKTNIDDYDAGWWTYYDVTGNLANKGYHNIHIKLLDDLYGLTSERRFLEASEDWSRYKKSYFIREFIKQKPNYHDLTIVGLNGIGTFVSLEMVLAAVVMGSRIRRGSTSGRNARPLAADRTRPRH